MDNITFQHPSITDLKDMIGKSARQYGDRTAYQIKNGDGSFTYYSYSRVYEMVEALGTSLCNMGLKGKKIAVIGENRFEWEIAYLSVVCGTGIVVPLDKSLPANELESVIERSGVRAVIYSDKYRDVLKKIKFRGHNNLRHLISMDLPCHSGGAYSLKELIEYGGHLIEAGFDEFTNARVNPYIMNVMLFTSGTTSRSKVVALSHNNICSNLLDLENMLDISQEDIFLSFLPLHHVFECTVGFLFPLYKGAKITFSQGARRLVQDLREYKATFFACVPAVYEMIFTHVRKNIEKENKLEEILALQEVHKNSSMEERKKAFKFIHDMLGGNIRYFISGAAPLDPDIENRYRVMGLNILQAYGLTETSPVISSSTNENHKIGSVGKALPNVQVSIADPDENGIGELVVKGPNIMMGYYDDPEGTSEVLENGWFHTGDLARIDSEGYIFICGRQKSVIVLKNGKNIFPEEMEQIINKIEGVEESMIYGKQHGKDKDDVRIYCKIVYNPEMMKRVYKANSPEDVHRVLFSEIKAVNHTMPAYKAIRGIVVSREPLIKTTTNKIKRQEEMKRL